MIHTLSLAAPSKPPTEFLIFSRGINATTRGDFLFDDAAAQSVMAAYEREGVDLIVDLEHASLDPAALAQRSDAADARGWLKLALRNGALWGVSVTWSPDGVRRLSEKTQRYLSPAFLATPDGRIQSLINVGLVAQPATHNAPALVAAGKYTNTSSGVLAARVPNAVVDVFRALAKQANVAPGVLIRRCLVSLAAAPADAAATGLDTIRKALGLDPAAGRAEIVEALDALLTLVGGDPADAPAPDPMAAAAAPAPAPLFATSKHEQELLAKMTPEHRARYLELRKSRDASKPKAKPAARTSPADHWTGLSASQRQSALKKFGSREAFQLACSKATRRA